MALLQTIFAREGAEVAREHWGQIADALVRKRPKLTATIDGTRDEVLAYLAFRASIGPRLTSSTRSSA